MVQIGDDEARVRPLRADLDAGDHAFDAAPTRGPVVKFLESPGFARDLVSARLDKTRVHAGVLIYYRFDLLGINFCASNVDNAPASPGKKVTVALPLNKIARINKTRLVE
jgi:hypothetical protein